MAQDKNTSTRSIFMLCFAVVLVATSALIVGGQAAAPQSAEEAQVLAATGYDYYSVVLSTPPRP